MLVAFFSQGGATSINGGLNTLDSSDLYAVAHEGQAAAGAGGNGGGGGHMTPRRVKRRSYTRSSARSASAAGTSNKAAKGSNHRSSTRSLRTTGKRGQQGTQNPSSSFFPQLVLPLNQFVFSVRQQQPGKPIDGRPTPSQPPAVRVSHGSSCSC